MRLGTVLYNGSTRAARLIDGDTKAVLLDAADLTDLLRRGVDGAADGEVIDSPTLTKLLDPTKVVCVGLNYLDHIKETGNTPPQYPTLFDKFADTVIGPFDDIEIPAETDMIDWEAELTVVIGREARRVSEVDAYDYVAGYTVGNDISMRDYQRRTTQYLQGKTWEASNPLGPVMVTGDEIDNASDLRITTKVGDEIMQDSRTSQLCFNVRNLVAYCSVFTTLRPGDVIMTGTPGGVGHARNPQRFLQRGEIVEVAIEGIGACRNRMV